MGCDEIVPALDDPANCTLLDKEEPANRSRLNKEDRAYWSYSGWSNRVGGNYSEDDSVTYYGDENRFWGNGRLFAHRPRRRSQSSPDTGHSQTGCTENARSRAVQPRKKVRSPKDSTRPNVQSPPTLQVEEAINSVSSSVQRFRTSFESSCSDYSSTETLGPSDFGKILFGGIALLLCYCFFQSPWKQWFQWLIDGEIS